MRLHGAAHARLADGSEVPLERKQAAIVAWLATHGATPRSRLAGLLWPEAGEARARGNLRQRLSKLRQAAGDVVEDEAGLLALAEGIAIDAVAPGSEWLDAFSFDDCSDFAAWLDSERDTQRGARRQALLVAVREAAQRGELDRALAQADELLAVDRESEEAYRALMEVLYLRGDRAAAIAVWDRCRGMLRSLYGVSPSAATQRLGQTILDTAEAAEAAPSLAIPVTVLRPPRLIGRAGVIASMLASWRIGHAIVVGGEAGVGKSRVLAEFAAAVGPCAFASARPGDAVMPFASLGRIALAVLDRFDPPCDDDTAHACARLLPQLAARLGSAEPEPLRTAHERQLALAALARLFDAAVAKQCAAFVFDDLQFADAASVEAMQWLVEREAPEGAAWPARLALGSRSEEEGPQAMALVASLAASRRLLRIALEPLDESETRELMASLELPGFDAERQSTRLRRRVGGNPAFLLESVKLIAALGQLGAADSPLPVPPGIEAVVERRLALLSPAARHIAELAAVAGESYGAPLAAHALGRSLLELAEPLRELEWRQVLYGREFVHDVVASSVRKTMADAVAELLHRVVAEWLAERGGAPAVVAGHWSACGEWLRAGQAFRAAAEAARRASRPADEAAHLDAAADCFLRCGARADRFAVLCERQQATAAPDYTRTRVAQIEAIEAAAVGEAQELQALAARVSWQAAHARSEMLAAGERGLARAVALGLESVALDIAHPVAWQLAVRGESARALEVIAARESWALAQPDARTRARYYTVRHGIHAFCDRLADALVDGERAVAILREADDPIEMLALLSNIGLIHSWRGEHAAGHEVLRQARNLRDRLHGRGGAVLIDVHDGAALRDLGRYAESLAVLEPAIAYYGAQLIGAGEESTDLVVGENHLAWLWLLLGDAERAAAALRTDAASTEARFQVRRALLEARIARRRGRPADLPVDARQAIAEMPHAFNRVLAELELARHETAADSAARVAGLMETPAIRERPGLRMAALALQAEASMVLGRSGAARRSAEALLDLATPGLLPFDADPVRVWRAAHAALEGPRPHLALAAAGRADAWLRSVERQGVPEGAEAGYTRLHAADCAAMGIAAPFARSPR